MKKLPSIAKVFPGGLSPSSLRLALLAGLGLSLVIILIGPSTSKVKMERLKSGSASRGKGLKIIHEQIELLNKLNSRHINLYIRDLSGESGRSGTEV